MGRGQEAYWFLSDVRTWSPVNDRAALLLSFRGMEACEGELAPLLPEMEGACRMIYIRVY